MNKELLETIKSLNIKFDGSLNSDTVEMVANTLIPYVTAYFVYQACMTILAYLTTILCVFLICRATMAYWKKVSRDN
jgi:hypothetical protein